MTPATEAPRLIDEFRAEVRLRELSCAPHVEECFMFGDLEWTPQGPDVLERARRDPALLAFGRTRYVALARIAGEIRYFAAPVQPGTDFAKHVAVCADKLDLEREGHEAGVVDSVPTAVDLVDAYLRGDALSKITVHRKIG